MERNYTSDYNCKLQQLARALDCYRLDNLDITETHMLHSGKYIVPDSHFSLHSGRDDGKRGMGVGIAIAKRVRESLISFVAYSSRIMTAHLYSKQANIAVAVAYSSSEVSKILTKVEFYKELNAVKNQIPRGDVDISILIEHFNAQVRNDMISGKELQVNTPCTQKEMIMGNSYLTDFCCLNEYVVGGTLYI